MRNSFTLGLAAVVIKHALKVSPLSSLLGEASDKVCEATLADDTPPQEEEGGAFELMYCYFFNFLQGFIPAFPSPEEPSCRSLGFRGLNPFEARGREGEIYYFIK